MKQQQFDARELIHTPAEAAESWVRWAQQRKDAPGSSWGIPRIDRVVVPERPGELICIMGRPGDGKSSLLAYRARREAQLIRENPRREKDVVVYVTWENSVEELVTMLAASRDTSASDIAWGRADMDAVKRQSVKMAGSPIWFIGHGIGRAHVSEDHRKTPRMTPDVVFDAIEAMKASWGVNVSLMLFDYLQLIPIAGRSRRVEVVTEVPVRIKELAMRVGCPAIAAVQARREVDDYDIKLPRRRDAQWASAITQTADKLFGLWRPWNTESDRASQDKIYTMPNGARAIRGAYVDVWGQQYQISETLLLMQMLKQRGDSSRANFSLHFHPAYLKLAELEVQRAGNR